MHLLIPPSKDTSQKDLRMPTGMAAACDGHKKWERVNELYSPHKKSIILGLPCETNKEPSTRLTNNNDQCCFNFHEQNKIIIKGK